jgi:hypothetical protein
MQKAAARFQIFMAIVLSATQDTFLQVGLVLYVHLLVAIP